MLTRIEAPLRVARGAADYPARLERLGDAAPEFITLSGNPAPLEDPIVGLFCSVRVPGRAAVEAYDVALQLSGSGSTIAGGFHSPLERELLPYLLSGSASVVVCPARGLEGMRMLAGWRQALAESRLLLLSAFPSTLKRPTLAAAELRNRVVAALSSRLIVLHASSGGRLAHLTREAVSWGLPVDCLDHSANEDLRIAGARPLPRSTPAAS